MLDVRAYNYFLSTESYVIDDYFSYAACDIRKWRIVLNYGYFDMLAMWETIGDIYYELYGRI